MSRRNVSTLLPCSLWLPLSLSPSLQRKLDMFATKHVFLVACIFFFFSSPPLYNSFFSPYTIKRLLSGNYSAV